MDYYNKTNTANTENRMKLQLLRLAITQDKELYQQHTSYLAAKRTASGTIKTNTETIQHISREFFGIIKQHAKLLETVPRTTAKTAPNR